jgi:hypothetical protein
VLAGYICGKPPRTGKCAASLPVPVRVVAPSLHIHGEKFETDGQSRQTLGIGILSFDHKRIPSSLTRVDPVILPANACQTTVYQPYRRKALYPGKDGPRCSSQTPGSSEYA